VDSAGAGAFRGGVSGENAITPYGTDQINLVASTLTSNHTSSAGLAGGYPGGGSQVLLKRDTRSVEAMLQDRHVPGQWDEVAGDEIVLAPKEAIVLRAGDVFNGVPPGGGGFRDPLERDPELVGLDVRDGYFRRERAQEVFGVVLDPVTSAVEVKATERERLARLTARVKSAGRYAFPKSVRKDWNLKDTRRRFGETLRIDRGKFVCARCDEPLADTGSNVKESLPTDTQELTAAGPWVARRWGGVSPDFHLVEYLCPGCGYCIDRTQRRKSEQGPWNDYRLNDMSEQR
jgi:hypothetical protein